MNTLTDDMVIVRCDILMNTDGSVQVPIPVRVGDMSAPPHDSSIWPKRQPRFKPSWRAAKEARNDR